MSGYALSRRALAFAVFACAVSGVPHAQQLPVLGCQNAIPCVDEEGHRGFGDQFLSQGRGKIVFSTAASFGRGLDLHLLPGTFVQGSKERASSPAVAEAARAFVAAHPVSTLPARDPAPGDPAPAPPPAPAPKSL